MQKKYRKVNSWVEFAHKTYLPLYCLILTFVLWLKPRLMDLPFNHLDPSYHYAVELAAREKLSFGTDFISTYGPLGHFLYHASPESLLSETIWFIVASTLLGLGVFLFCRLYLVGTFRRLIAATLLIYFSTIALPEWGYMIIFILYGFIYLKAKGRNKIYITLFLALFAALLSLMKFTLGFSTTIALLMLVFFSAPKASLITRTKDLLPPLSLYLTVFFSLGSLLGVTNFIEYFKTALIISNKFSSGMSQVDPSTWPATVLVALSLVLLIMWVYVDEKRGSVRYVFLLPLLFVLWKYCIVRQDGHITVLLQVLPVITLLIYFSRNNKLQRNIIFAMLIVFISMLALWANKIPFNSGKNSFVQLISSPAHNLVDAKFIDFFNLKLQKDAWHKRSDKYLEEATVSPSMKDKIGESRVDIFPWEVSVIRANNLNWGNRPSPFSFQDYDPYIDIKNSDFINSNKAPDFILWHTVGSKEVGGIDDRYLIWDEPATFRSILSKYEYVENTEKFILLRKKTLNIDFKEKPLAQINSGTPSIELQEYNDDLIYVRFETAVTTRDRLETFILRQDPFYIHIKQKNGEEYRYRFIRENSQQGFLINNLPSDWDELVYLFKNKKINQETASFRVEGREIQKAQLFILD